MKKTFQTKCGYLQQLVFVGIYRAKVLVHAKGTILYNNVQSAVIASDRAVSYIVYYHNTRWFYWRQSIIISLKKDKSFWKYTFFPQFEVIKQNNHIFYLSISEVIYFFKWQRRYIFISYSHAKYFSVKCRYIKIGF